MNSLAAKVGCTPEALRRWVRQSEQDQGIREGLSNTERENREINRANEILRQASAYFAQAELDRQRQ